MRRWIIGGAVVMTLMVAALTVPMRDAGTVSTTVTEVAAEEGVCGQVTSAGDLELQRTVPLIDLGLLMRVEVALTNPRLELTATEACGDVDYLAGGVVLTHPLCDDANTMSATEAEAFENARIESGSAAVELCGGDALALLAQSDQGGSRETSATWSDQRYELGSAVVANELYWCLDTAYWVDVHVSTADSAGSDSRGLEPVAAAWCVDLVNT